ncbi:hypothetical protein CONPUDRAFT_107921 [Coniophora puteana RWD-64-598 SS2]|uniref:Uncharacterized protein n=1 Tax=Coniophora puteana (strain RWD-64-598) TaxID=741705 RepID=A0A5M3MGU5_CONPW|nr:uncharacterized protein CONPUDRAFT_107921 [Coniophora puteana RWD-64-598 SS2]EIW78170.1 hypothetical protein CONPUDRAFT_107921 [Coniophora puteana RWD-64-598 SS2]
MYVPLVTPALQYLERRKGGGGGSKGGGSSGSSGSTGKGSTGSSGSSSGGRGSTVPLAGSNGVTGSRSVSTYNSGGGKQITIPSGQVFSGRTAGGATRDQVAGTRAYGSGYPGVATRGVYNRGFPFWFWPVVWGGAFGGGGAYLVDHEYGDSYNTSRVGGPMMEATFVSNNTSSGSQSNATTFHLLADNSTVSALLPLLVSNCSSNLQSQGSSTNQTSQTPAAVNTSSTGAPQPFQAVQYYRASSVVLTLDGYNNSATLGTDDSIAGDETADTPLPSGIDLTLLDCLNQTIIQAAPLVDAAGGLRLGGAPSMQGMLGLAIAIWCLFGSFL